MQFYFELLALLRVLDSFGPHSLCDLQRAERAPTPIAADAPVTLSLLDEPAPAADLDLRLAIRNLVPGHFLKPRFEALHSVTLFSATLGTADYQRDLLGLPADTAWID
ncbi:hypothetical protein EIA20_26700, partial [Escherichia coli]|uniref:hypothetical protein n=1 Tax=Escherichia coli TaxID=562 RepID=UPI000FC395C7